MNWLIEPFSFDFMQRALVAGLLSVLITSLVGTWVVVRGLTFIGDALAHGVIPGIALGLLAGFDPNLGAVLAAAFMVGAIGYVHRRTQISEDAGIGLLFVGMLALGVVLISRSDSYAGDLTAILFGDALGTSSGDLWLLAGAALLTGAATVGLFRSFLVLSFDERKAEMLGLRPRVAHLAMLALVTVAVVSAFRSVGTLLVFGLLIAPPATAVLVVRRVPAVMAAAVGFGAIAVVVGLFTSFHANTAAGATVAGLSVAIFFLVLVIHDVFRRRSRARAGAGRVS